MGFRDIEVAIFLPLAVLCHCLAPLDSCKQHHISLFLGGELGWRVVCMLISVMPVCHTLLWPTGYEYRVTTQNLLAS